jgi:PKD repeat protein
MKRILLTCIAVLGFAVAFSQAVQRDMVILEIGTGTGCPYCPGAAMGAADLLAAGCHVAVIEYHNYNSSDPFNNPAAAARCSYYGISGYPTAFFDGTVNFVGGSNNTSMYAQYLPLYTQQYAVPSPLVIDMTGSNVGNNYTINLTITKLAVVTGTNLKVHLALTESDIQYSWQGQTEINDTERLMVPDAQGTSISFASGNTVNLTLTFTKDPTWVAANCELIAFVQDVSTKTIYNGTKKGLTDLYFPLATDFSATPTSGCTPLTVAYTDLSAGATAWNWSFPGGTPATSTQQNPTVVYNTVGAFDATLVASNPSANAQGTMTKTGYINTNTTPLAPIMPQGNAAMCINPPAQTYTITPVANTTGYTWELTPAVAGTLAPNGTSCTVDFNDTWTGQAQLRVQGVNACGSGIWSSAMVITISETPGTATTPTGPTSLCMNAANTDYTTTATPPATTYQWELVPADAGALYPSMTTVTIDWVNTFSGSCQLRVKPINGVCEGAWTSFLTINIEAGPTAYNLTGGGAYCGQGGNGSPVGLDGSQSGVNYTLYLDGTATTTVVAGNGNAISFGNQMTAGNYTVQAGTAGAGCPNTMNGSAVVTIDPQVPNVPAEPVGPELVYSGATPTSEYLTTGGTYATTYSWELLPAAAGTITGNSTTGLATWDPAYAGDASIRVKGINACGGGTFSTEYVVTVDVGVGMTEPTRTKLISIFPNPARGTVTIIPDRSLNADLQVYNSLGETLISKSNLTLTGNHQLDISALKSGIYFIRVNSSGAQQILKLIVE